jgi:hypothetical protein
VTLQNGIERGQMTMDERMNEAWTDVAEGFSALGGAMKDKLRGTDEEPEPAGELVAAGDALRDALDRLIAAASDVGQRTVGLVRDEDVRVRVRDVATSLNEALGATVDLVGREVSALFRRPDRPPAAPGGSELPPTTAPGGDPVGDVDDGRRAPEEPQ